MGSSGSKAVGKTSSKLSASNTGRKYPTRTPPPSARTNTEPLRPNHETPLGPTVHPETHTSSSRDQTITKDASDPDLTLQDRLRSIGPVQPNPTQSNSSIFNTATTFSTSTALPRNPSNPRPTTQQPALPAFQTSQFQPSASSPEQTIFPSTSGPGSGLERQNPALSLLTARYRLAEEAENEFAQMGRESARREGRKFLDVMTIRQVLIMREQGRSEEAIESGLGLKRGVVGRLGRRGIVGVGG